MNSSKPLNNWRTRPRLFWQSTFAVSRKSWSRTPGRDGEYQWATDYAEDRKDAYAALVYTLRQYKAGARNIRDALVPDACFAERKVGIAEGGG